jgi:hypothetical protein
MGGGGRAAWAHGPSLLCQGRSRETVAIVREQVLEDKLMSPCVHGDQRVAGQSFSPTSRFVLLLIFPAEILIDFWI